MCLKLHYTIFRKANWDDFLFHSSFFIPITVYFFCHTEKNVEKWERRKTKKKKVKSLICYWGTSIFLVSNKIWKKKFGEMTRTLFRIHKHTHKEIIRGQWISFCLLNIISSYKFSEEECFSNNKANIYVEFLFLLRDILLI